MTVVTAEATVTSTFSETSQRPNRTVFRSVISQNTTVYYSAIVSLESLYAEDACGWVGRNFTATSLIINATFLPDSAGNASQAMSSCSAVETVAPSVFAAPRLQALTVPAAMLARDPAWANCTTDLSGCYDPPSADTMGSVAAGITLPQRPGLTVKSPTPSGSSLVVTLPSAGTVTPLPQALSQNLGSSETESLKMTFSTAIEVASTVQLSLNRPIAALADGAGVLQSHRIGNDAIRILAATCGQRAAAPAQGQAPATSLRAPDLPTPTAIADQIGVAALPGNEISVVSLVIVATENQAPAVDSKPTVVLEEETVTRQVTVSVDSIATKTGTLERAPNSIISVDASPPRASCTNISVV